VETDTESYVLSPAYKPADSISNVSASGPGAEAPAAAGGFERIWRAYAKYGNKASARKAFDAIPNPDVDHIAKRAASWAASAKPGQRRMPLERWLAAEKYDEADRAVAPKPAKPNPRKPAAPPTERPVEETITLTGATLVQIDDRKVLRLAGAGFEHDITTEADDADEQKAGQRELNRLADITDVGEIHDPAVLIGKSVSVTWFGDRPVLSRAAGSVEVEEATPTAVAPPPAFVEPAAPPRSPKPKPKIAQRAMPPTREGKLEMIERWRRNGFFEPDDEAA
jgi:hypothetical protein